MKKSIRDILIYIIVVIIMSFVLDRGDIDWEIIIVSCVSFIVTSLVISCLKDE